MALRKLPPRSCVLSRGGDEEEYCARRMARHFGPSPGGWAVVAAHPNSADGIFPHASRARRRDDLLGESRFASYDADSGAYRATRSSQALENGTCRTWSLEAGATCASPRRRAAALSPSAHVPRPDGSYPIPGRVSSAGEHDYRESIVHLVLARLPDAPPGRGISLFVVRSSFPVRWACSARRLMSVSSRRWDRRPRDLFDRLDGATGWLVGEPHRACAPCSR